jgi:SAM-dependent methyltransferase
MEAIRPTSVVDVGCGSGVWLSEFISAGVEDVLGVDGDYVARDRLSIPAAAFHPHDLREALRLPRRFDLAVSVEVAEHLPPERGASLVADLVALAPAVLFSAAVPGQTGRGHINERWQDEWASLFVSHGYRTVDVIRAVTWTDPRVAFWYAQNALLYLAADVPMPPSDQALPLRIVHPRLFSERLEAEQLDQRTLRELARALPAAFRKSVAHRASKATRRAA